LFRTTYKNPEIVFHSMEEKIVVILLNKLISSLPITT
jgi:hypothetical protein